MNDFIINVGQTREELRPFESAANVRDAFERAEELTAEYKCIEVVYMPEDDDDINEVVWTWYN